MDAQFQQVDFGPLRQFLDNDDVTDISYSNGGQVWLKTLSKGVYRVENTGIDNTLVEKIAFQCANTMGKSFNMANPFLDAESAELRLNFVHDSIARNGVALLVRKTPAKIRLVKEKIIEDYDCLLKHRQWYDEMCEQYDISADNVDDILANELTRIFVCVLEDAGVFKMDDEGIDSFISFVESMDKGGIKNDSSD